MADNVQARAMVRLADEERRATRALSEAKGARDRVRIRAGEAVRTLREQRGLSLRELARRCDVSAAMMSDFELGRRWSDSLWLRASSEVCDG